jgi:hypothetical protein
MQLDSSRNHIMHYNLWLSMVSVSVMAATLLPCFFGNGVFCVCVRRREGPRQQGG